MNHIRTKLTVVSLSIVVLIGILFVLGSNGEKPKTEATMAEKVMESAS